MILGDTNQSHDNWYDAWSTEAQTPDIKLFGPGCGDGYLGLGSGLVLYKFCLFKVWASTAQCHTDVTLVFFCCTAAMKPSRLFIPCSYEKLKAQPRKIYYSICISGLH